MAIPIPKIPIGVGFPLYKGVEYINQMIEEVNNFQEQINQIVVEGDSSVEAAQARVDEDGKIFSTLKERLDDTDERLSEKATKGQIISEDLRTTQDSDRLGLINLKEEVIQAMTGNTSVGTIPENGSVTIEKLAPDLQGMYVLEGSDF
jgi:hypothetical protein